MDTTLIVAGGAAIFIIALVIWNLKTEQRLRRLLAGKNAATLEDTIGALVKEVATLQSRESAIDAHFGVIDERLRHTVRDIATVRYNPFHDSGSNQSFATALVSDNGDGVVISSLYSRERVSVFAKPVKQGKPEYELTEEESSALSAALGK